METVKLFEHMKEQLILGTEEEIQRELNLLYEGLKNGMSINAETAHRMFSGLLLQLYQTKLPKRIQFRKTLKSKKNYGVLSHWMRCFPM